MPTTTKMGIVYPSSTDLVKDGATAMGTISTTVDSKTGLVLLNTTSFTAQSSVSINSVFNSNFDNYKIVFNYLQNTSTAELRFRLRLSGTDNSSAIYYFANTQRTSAGTSVTNNGATQTSFSLFAAGASTANEIFITSEISKPALAVSTNMAHLASYYNDGSNYASNMGGGWHNANTAYDGFTFYPTAGTITGTVRVYGINQ